MRETWAKVSGEFVLLKALGLTSGPKFLDESVQDLLSGGLYIRQKACRAVRVPLWGTYVPLTNTRELPG